MKAANHLKIMNAADHLKEWGFSGIVTILCFGAALAYVMHPIDMGKPETGGVNIGVNQAQTAGKSATGDATERIENLQTRAITAPQASGLNREKAATGEVAVNHASWDKTVRLLFQMFLLLAVGTSFLWFIFAFTGNPSERRSEGVKFAYFFVIASFSALAIPPLVKSQAIGNEPIGIISGCVKDGKAPEQLRCTSPNNTPGDAAAPLVKSAEKNQPEGRNQWLVNIGGTLTPQSEHPKNNGKVCDSNEPECKIGSMNNRAYITGGLIVPLPFVMIALFGGAISLSRRVPEIQKCSEVDYIGSATEPKLPAGEVRERLAFQIMQFISAPLIAVVAYQVIQPESQASSAGLAFMSGFGSEAILLMIRGVVGGMPKQRSAAAPTGAVGGVISDTGKLIAGVEVAIAGSLLKTETDKHGRYLIRNVPVGAQKIMASHDKANASVDVSVLSGQTTSCDIALTRINAKSEAIAFTQAQSASPSGVLSLAKSWTPTRFV